MTVKACLKSMRLRTLPLSLSGTVMGIAWAAQYAHLSFPTLFFLVLTTCCLQILSNLSNELGDSLHGTDTAERQGMHYSIMDGEMTVSQMKILIGIIAFVSCISGLAMIRFAFGTLFSVLSLVFIALGGCAVAAAMKYTLGKNPYGYRGLGDIFVFVFFGLVSTCGAYFICSRNLGHIANVLLPACAIGFFSIGVLNVNNIRDMLTDAQTRTTVALKLGARGARIYQSVLIAAGWICMIVNTLLHFDGWLDFLYVVTLPLFAAHLVGVWKRDGRQLDAMLPLLVMSTFILSLTNALFI